MPACMPKPAAVRRKPERRTLAETPVDRAPRGKRRQCRALSGACADLSCRDVDISLPVLGEEQARALGQWFTEQLVTDRPGVPFASPYLRAQETTRLFRAAGEADGDEPICIDERLREKEFGILDCLTTGGVASPDPEQAEFRRLLGKFYHRPPGGEGWCDVIFRLRSLLDTIALHHAGQRVMIAAH